MRRFCIVPALIAFSLPLLAGGCGPRALARVGIGLGTGAPQAQAVAKGSFQTEADGAKQVAFLSDNGDLEIRPAEDGKISLALEVTASGPLPAEVLSRWANESANTVGLEREGDRLVLRLLRPVAAPADLGLSIHVRASVPARLEVQVATQNGRIDVEGIDGAVTLESQNGDVTGRRLAAAVQAKTANGRIEIEDARGGAHLEDQNGDVSAKKVRGAVRASSANGRVQVTEADSGSDEVSLESENGDVEFAGIAGTLVGSSASGRIQADLAAAPKSTRLTSRNGDVEVRLPPDPDLDVDAESENGDVEVSHPGARPSRPEREGEGTRSSWRGTLGRGGQPLVAKTSSGSIRIQGH